MRISNFLISATNFLFLTFLHITQKIKKFVVKKIVLHKILSSSAASKAEKYKKKLKLMTDDIFFDK